MANRRTYTITHAPKKAIASLAGIAAAQDNYAYRKAGTPTADDVSIRVGSFIAALDAALPEHDRVGAECCPLTPDTLMVRYCVSDHEIARIHKKMKSAGVRFTVEKGG